MDRQQSAKQAQTADACCYTCC